MLKYIDALKKNLKTHYEVNGCFHFNFFLKRGNLNKLYLQQKMVEQEQKNNKILIEKGAIDSENETKYKELTNTYQKTLDNINM